MESILFILIFLIVTPLLGSYFAMIFKEGRKGGRLENFFYQIGGVNPYAEMTWQQYGKALFIFNCFGFLSLFLVQLFQFYLPLNPQHLANPSWDLSFNTAVSFTTNTNWQAYGGESTLSYFSQMLGLTSQNFLSAATGMATLLVLIRGLIRSGSPTVGNFWTDLVRTILYILLPLAILLAIILVFEGSIQTLSPYREITTLEGVKEVIPLGPVASQVAIKQLGTNGGGFFNANSAHPFENPTPLTNFLETLSIVLIPAASIYTYGLMTNCKKHAVMLFLSAIILFIAALSVSLISENYTNPEIGILPNLEGKETRFGVTDSLLWSNLTTDTSNGSVNSMLSSLTPLSGGMALFNIMLGEIVLGGMGVGLCGLLMFTLLTVFLSGLMVGRTPEYRGKKIEKNEIRWVVLAVLTPSALVLIGVSLSIMLPGALKSLDCLGPHGLSEMLYTFSSAAFNNGSSFAGFNANTTYYNLILGGVMLLGRASIILPSLAIGGLLAKKKSLPESSCFCLYDTPFFLILLLGIILIVGALTFFPALTLGPILEQLLMVKGKLF